MGLVRARTFLLFMLLCLVWGTTYAGNKIALAYIAPVFFSGLRLTVAGALLMVVALLTSGLSAKASEMKHILILAITNSAIFTALLTYGLTGAGAGESSIFIYTQPLLVAGLAVVFLGERLRGWQVVGLGLGFAGVVSVLTGKVEGFRLDAWWAYLALLGAALSWACGTVYFRARPLRTPLVWLVALQSLIGGLLLLSVAWPIDRFHAHWTPTLAVDLAFLSVVGVGFSYWLWFKLIEHGELSRLVAYLFMVPVFAALIGIVVLGERLLPLTVAGLLLTMGGIYLVNRPSEAPSIGPLSDGSAELPSKVIA